MADEFGPDFITVTDEDGNDIELEFIDALEHGGTRYMAFFLAETADENGEPSGDQDPEMVILKVMEENGEELLSTLDSDQELEHIYELFMERFLEDAEDEDDD